jgi:UDP-N-acetylmuramoyl-tripeptide--D-alanyl-D-alanine ligase
MLSITLDEIASWLLLPPVERQALTGISIDSRQVLPGHLFVAIRGARMDGHDFIDEAIKKGAVAVLCNAPAPHQTVPQLVMPCTIDALAIIATHHRRRLGCEVIALTGSNGKTTVKEMLASLLPQPSFATPGNLNNHLGVPLSLLQLTPRHRYGVFELGANHCGEIAHTVAMVKPMITLINNIAPAHLEGFGSLEGVIRAKGEIHQGLLPGGTAVVNADDASAHCWDEGLTDKHVVRFSAQSPEQVHARDVVLMGIEGARFTLVTPDGEVPVRLNVPGLHNVRNALAAASCGFVLGVALSDIASGLERFTGVAGRLACRVGKHQSRILDDTYNANLKSVLAAIEVLASQAGQRILVLGDLGELGAFSEAHHAEIGHAARDHGIDVLMTCGVLSQAAAQAYGASGQHYTHQEALLTDLLGLLDEQTTVLVKGSRSSAMEHIVHQLVE